MPCRNTLEGYGSVSKFFHWTIAVLFLVQVTIGATMGDIANKFARSQVYTFHKSLGLTILTLMILFIAWSLTNKKPAWPGSMPSWERVSAKAVHYALYVLFILTPITGWWMSTASGHAPNVYWLFTWPMPSVAKNKSVAEFYGTWHEILAYLVTSVVIIHFLAALKHHFISKDNVLKKMLP